MRYDTGVHVEAAAGDAWNVLSDIRGWPEWTPTVTAVDGPRPPLRLGQVYELTQPGRRPTSYTVEDLVDGQMFVWRGGNAVLHQAAGHVVTPSTDEACEVELWFELSGALGGVLGALAGDRVRELVDTEAASLKGWLERRG